MTGRRMAGAGALAIGIIFLGLIFVGTGSQRCGNVPAATPPDSVSPMLARGDTIAAADPRIGTSAVRYACATTANKGDGRGLFTTLGVIALITGLALLVWPAKTTTAHGGANGGANGGAYASVKTWRCLNCGTENASTAATCGRCGRTRGSPSAQSSGSSGGGTF